MLLDKKNKARIFVLTLFFVVGLLLGGLYTWITNTTVEMDTYNADTLTNKLHFAKVQEGSLQCQVLVDKAAVYNQPSGLNGKIVEYMSKGVEVKYLSTVSSMDKDDKYAVTIVPMEFQKFWGRKHFIPEGSKVRILEYNKDGSEILGQVYVDDKYYEKDFSIQYLQFPYLGQWKEIEFNGKRGYMQFNTLSDARLM